VVMPSTAGRGRWVALAAVLVGTFTGAVNSSIANVAVLDVLREFDLDISTGAWFVLGYTVAFVVLMPVVGRLAGRIGLRRVYLTGMVVFAVASAGAATSPGYEWLTVARVLQGVGAAPVLPVVMLVVAREFPSGARGRAMGAWASMNGAALALGPVIGGVVTEAYGWRMIFWLDVPLALGALVLAYAALPRDRVSSRRRLDVATIVLLCGGLASVMLALSAAPSWGSAGLRQAAFAMVGAVLLVGFWRRSHHVPVHREPVVGVDVLRDGAFAALASMAALQMALLAVVLFSTPLMLSVVFDYGVAVVGVITFLVPVSMVLFGPISGYLADRMGARLLAIVGGLLLVGSSTMIAGGVGGQAMSIVVTGLVVTGVGVAAIQAPVAVSVAERVDGSDRGAAMGLFHSARFAGAVAGTSTAAAVVELVAGARFDVSTAGGDLHRAFASVYWLAAVVALALLAMIVGLHPRDADGSDRRTDADAPAEESPSAIAT
jgi:EmrB/QacA subfamily drug resistance transporter